MHYAATKLTNYLTAFFFITNEAAIMYSISLHTRNWWDAEGRTDSESDSENISLLLRTMWRANEICHSQRCMKETVSYDKQTVRSDKITVVVQPSVAAAAGGRTHLSAGVVPLFAPATQSALSPSPLL